MSTGELKAKGVDWLFQQGPTVVVLLLILGAQWYRNDSQLEREQCDRHLTQLTSTFDKNMDKVVERFDRALDMQQRFGLIVPPPDHAENN